MKLEMPPREVFRIAFRAPLFWKTDGDDGDQQKFARLFVYDIRSKFLVDIGVSAIFLLCKSFPSKVLDPSFTLYTANETRIPTISRKELTPDLDLG
ncbi:hypothetical protein TNIN_227331 [Trichonephila inaurata madagascariensis]|uniref:Uncharacterized protein n=1 Tax=Trichonephila inaurata madagascariensis TaxID=2747483 RepID=A0A8X7BZC3_9ARAC|nr:hypothetical protein TNIN_227331 [Trichonephila inaurata madagascariensis]